MIHTCTIQRRYVRQRLTFSAGAGTPVIGQTVTGADSGEEGVIVRAGADFLIVQAGGAAFTPGEAISTPTWSATLSGQADSKNQSGEQEQYWTDDQTGIPCRFYVKAGGFGQYRHEAGDMPDSSIACLLPSSVTIGKTGYRIATTAAEYAGQYDILKLYPRSGGAGLHHYEAELSEVL